MIVLLDTLMKSLTNGTRKEQTDMSFEFYPQDTILYCDMSGEVFAKSCEKGYDSKKFVEGVLSSKEGSYLYSDKCAEMWYGSNYVLEGLELEVNFEQGKVYSPDVMYWMGYIYKMWSILYPDEQASFILEQAPFDIMVGSYTGLHCLSAENAILNLKEIYESTKAQQ